MAPPITSFYSRSTWYAVGICLLPIAADQLVQRVFAKKLSANTLEVASLVASTITYLVLGFQLSQSFRLGAPLLYLAYKAALFYVSRKIPPPAPLSVNIGLSQNNTENDARKKVGNERPVEHSSPANLIPSQVKATLDDLFGGPGSVDHLPVYEGNCNLDVDTMANSSMVGSAGPKQRPSNPYIATKMRCLSTAEEIKQKLPFITKYVDGSIERVLILRPGFIQTPLAWEQDEGYGVHPQFFKGSLLYQGNFTYPNDGQLNASHVQGFELLKRLLKEGKGEDINGLRWEIIGHRSKEPS